MGKSRNHNHEGYRKPSNGIEINHSGKVRDVELDEWFDEGDLDEVVIEPENLPVEKIVEAPAPVSIEHNVPPQETAMHTDELAKDDSVPSAEQIIPDYSREGVAQEVENLAEAEPESLIQSTQNFSELYTTLDTLRTVTGSTGHEYTADSLKHFIELVRTNYLRLAYITNTHGLREKVAELIAAERKSNSEQPKSPAQAESVEIPPTESPEPLEQAPQTESLEQPAQSEAVSGIDKAEYARLKREYKDSQHKYFAALEWDYADKGMLKKVLGLGRKDLSPTVKPSYDAFMEASQAFYSFTQQSRHAEKIAARLRRERSAEAVPNVNVLLYDRHVARPAHERNERQRVHLPEYVLNAKKALQEKMKQHPKTALGVGALLTVLNPAAVAAAVGVRYLGNKFYVAGKEERKEVEKNDAIESITYDREGASLRDLEALSFEAERQARDARVRTNIAAVGAAVAAGSAYGATGGETEPYFEGLSDGPISFEHTVEGESAIEAPNHPEPTELELNGKSVAERAVPLNVTELTPDDARPYDARLGYGEIASETKMSIEPEPMPETIPETPAFEMTRTVERGDTVSKIMLDSLREGLKTGEIVLPEGINQDRLAHYMYQSFPEMTDAADVEARLTPEEWRDVGVKSGNPNLIQQGEVIDMQKLIAHMRGASVEAISNSASVEQVVIPGTETSVPTVTPDTVMETAGQSPLAGEAVGGVETSVPPTPNPNPVAPAWGEVTSPTPEESRVLGAEEIIAPVVERGVSAETVPIEAVEGDAWLYKELKVEPSTVSSSEQVIGVSERLNSLVTVWPEDASSSLHEYLYKTMLQGHYTGHVTLPTETVASVVKDETALYGFIERYMPEVSENTLSKIFRGVGPDALSAEEWQALGVERGNPQMIAGGDKIQTGKIIQIILERAEAALNLKKT